METGKSISIEKCLYVKPVTDMLYFLATSIEATETTDPILGTKLEGLDITKYPLITIPIELEVGTRFSSWEIAEYYLKEYGRQKGFAIKRYRVEFYKNNKVKNEHLHVKRQESINLTRPNL